MRDQVSDIRLFEGIVRSGSLTAAGRELRLSTAVVSRRLAALESRLGIRLLVRTTRQTRLTPEGRRFFDRCVSILAQIESAETEAASGSGTPRGPLRIVAPISFGRRRIAPLIAEFHARYPAIEPQLVLSDADVDVVSNDVDVALRIGQPLTGDFLVRRILSRRRAAVASPEYLRRAGTPRHPADLAALDCLVLLRAFRPLNQWMFREDGTVQTVQVRGRLFSNSGEVIHEWALAGKGVALKSLWDVEEDLASGRLVEVLGEYAEERADLYLIFPERRNLPSRLRLFVDFLADSLVGESRTD